MEKLDDKILYSVRFRPNSVYIFIENSNYLNFSEGPENGITEK
jgi:hypothetical protein